MPPWSTPFPETEEDKFEVDWICGGDIDEDVEVEDVGAGSAVPGVLHGKRGRGFEPMGGGTTEELVKVDI